MKLNSCILLFLIVLLISAPVFSYENSMINMNVPTNLEPQNLEFRLQHRFYGPVNVKPADSLIGMSDGTNVELGLRYLIWSKFEAKASYTFLEKEYRLGGGYALFVPALFLKSQIEGEYFNFKDFNNVRHGGGFFQMDLETEMILGHIKPVLNAGYDGLNKKPGLALGIDLRIIGDFYLMGEYYPRLTKNSDKVSARNYGSGNNNCYALGAMYQIGGHHFVVQVGNSNEIGNRHLMLGTPHRQLFFGFNLERLF
jgi:hypothetical protein